MRSATASSRWSQGGRARLRWNWLMPSSTRSARILIITGEASGDLHGANLAAALKAKAPGLSILGVGGPRMQAAGVELVQSLGHLNVIGIAGPAAVRALARRVLAIRRMLRRDPLDLVVLIDNPGLNFHFARVAKRAGHRVVYYIAPQLWAWRPRRMRWIQRRVDYVVVILPFEVELYRRAGVPCAFVGHPLLDEVAPSYDRDRLPSIGLATLVAGRRFIPELIQHQATPARLAEEARRILDDASYRERMRTEMTRVKSLLGPPGASERAAAMVLQQLDRAEARV